MKASANGLNVNVKLFKWFSIEKCKKMKKVKERDSSHIVTIDATKT